MFHTKIEIPVSSLKISYEDKIMTLGSCFAENIGKRMKDVYFQTDNNPFGVLYNPISIKNSLCLLLQNKQFTINDIFENNGLWQSFSHSTRFSHSNAQICLDQINSRLTASRNFLKDTNVLVITFGTSWVFEEVNSTEVVSNCHKLPAKNFHRRRLSVAEIVDNFIKIICKLLTEYPDIQIIFSVSPIRHLKDGAVENNLSKSTLLLSVNELVEQFEHVHYFPAYEIQMDELRDYRYYAADMLHPSDVAVDYIWNRFSQTYFSSETMRIKKEVEQLNTDLLHRPLHPDSEEFRKFKLHVEQRKIELIKSYPFLETSLF